MSVNGEGSVPVGLRGDVGCHVLDQIVEASNYKESPQFSRAINGLWRQFANAGGPGCMKLLRPEYEARTFIVKEILPVMNMDSEVECYIVMNAIRHLEQRLYYDSPHPSWNDPDFELFDGGHIQFSRNRRNAVVDCLKTLGVEGTMFEQYLRYVINPHDCDSLDLFSIEGSRVARNWPHLSRGRESSEAASLAQVAKLIQHYAAAGTSPEGHRDALIFAEQLMASTVCPQ